MNKLELNIEYWPVENLVPYEKNAKIHSQAQVNKLAKIIKKDGFRVPISIDEHGVIIAGHGRRLAAIKLKLKQVPVIVQKGLTEEQKNAARISDNKVASVEYDFDLLSEEIMKLSETSEFDTGLLGMDDDELSNMIESMSAGLDKAIEEAIGAPIEDDIEVTTKNTKEVIYKPTFSVVVDCSDEADQEFIYNKLTAEGRMCKVQTM